MQWIPIDRAKAAYGAIPKVATNTILTVLAQSYGWGKPEYQVARSRSLGEPEKGWFTFTFVRNPFSRLVSAWLDKVYELRHGPEVMRCLQKQGLAINRGTSFRDFVRLLVQLNPRMVEPHFRPQRFILEPFPEPSFIGRFEKLSEDWSKVAEIIGAKVKLPYLNKAGSRRPYKSYYDTETRVLAEQWLKEDLVEWDYTWEDLPE